MAKKLVCVLGIHKIENCKCDFCGKELHKYRTITEWKDCEPTPDYICGSELIYTEEEFEKESCMACGNVKDYYLTGRVRGNSHY